MPIKINTVEIPFEIYVQLIKDQHLLSRIKMTLLVKDEEYERAVTMHKNTFFEPSPYLNFDR